MPVQELHKGEHLGLRRGEVAVCIPVYGGYDLFTQCFASVLRHTDSAVAILICDDANVDPRFPQFVDDTLVGGDWPHTVRYLRQPVNGGFVKNVNAGFAAAAPGDVVILNSDCVVTDGWLSGLRKAAYSDTKVATATALSNAGTIVSVPQRNHPAPALPADATVDGVAGAIRLASGQLYPDLPTCVGHCVYLRRSALELVGPFDTAFSPGYEEEVEFSQRCLIHGLRHVLADDVFVFHRHGGSFGASEKVERLRRDHHAIISSRYPYYDDWIAEVSDDPSSRLARSVLAAASAMRGTSVTIDGRCLTPVMTGTAIATLELIAALDTHTDLRLRVLVPPDLGVYAAGVLKGRASIEILGFDALAGYIELTDVVHRPHQVTSAEDLLLLRRLGRRLVVTQLDNIAYRNPAYFAGYEEWRRYRALTTASLAGADRVVFISRAGAADARSLDLVDEDRVQVIPLATEQVLAGLYPEPSAPVAADRIADRPFLLCLGTDFLHKNRPFAIRLLEALVEAGSFDGVLAFAGPKVSAGSSAGEEAAYLAARPALESRVIDLAAVDESAKLWLLSKAAAVVYPTTYEGFGLIPHEAARAGTPCLFAWHTSLSDYLPESLALIVPWDAQETAERVAPVLVAGEERDRLVAGVRMAGARLTVSRNARQHAEVYARALVAPASGAAMLARELLELERTRRELEAELGEIYDDPLNRGLAGRYAVLPEELRRPVLAVATRPALRATVTTLYRAARTARHSLGRPTKGEP
jgi:GT2 family glycosyltransferase/glycosyltransferase involved in cell wall biosynthesis